MGYRSDSIAASHEMGPLSFTKWPMILCLCNSSVHSRGLMLFAWKNHKNWWCSHLTIFLRRGREGISFPNFVERSILKLPLSGLCAVPLPLQNRALFEEKRAERCREKERKRGRQEKGKKGKKDEWKQVSHCIYLFQILVLLCWAHDSVEEGCSVDHTGNGCRIAEVADPWPVTGDSKIAVAWKQDSYKSFHIRMHKFVHKMFVYDLVPNFPLPNPATCWLCITRTQENCEQRTLSQNSEQTLQTRPPKHSRGKIGQPFPLVLNTTFDTSNHPKQIVQKNWEAVSSVVHTKFDTSNHPNSLLEKLGCIPPDMNLSGAKIASQNRSDNGGRKRARNHSAAEIARFFASPATKKLGVSLKIAGSSQRPRPQVAAIARFCGRSNHGTLRYEHNVWIMNKWAFQAHP